MKGLIGLAKLGAREAARRSGKDARTLARMADNGELTLLRSGLGRRDAMGRRRDGRVYLECEIDGLLDVGQDGYVRSRAQRAVPADSVCRVQPRPITQPVGG